MTAISHDTLPKMGTLRLGKGATLLLFIIPSCDFLSAHHASLSHSYIPKDKRNRVAWKHISTILASSYSHYSVSGHMSPADFIYQAQHPQIRDTHTVVEYFTITEEGICCDGPQTAVCSCLFEVCIDQDFCDFIASAAVRMGQSITANLNCPHSQIDFRYLFSEMVRLNSRRKLLR